MTSFRSAGFVSQVHAPVNSLLTNDGRRVNNRYISITLPINRWIDNNKFNNPLQFYFILWKLQSITPPLITCFNIVITFLVKHFLNCMKLLGESDIEGKTRTGRYDNQITHVCRRCLVSSTLKWASLSVRQV